MWLGLAFATAIIGIGVGIGSSISNRNYKKQQLELQEKQAAQDMVTSSKGTLNTSYSTIQSTLEKIDAKQTEISDNEYNIQVNNDWLKMYQDMLNGTGDEDNVLQSQYDVLSKNIELQQHVADAYLKSSAIARQQAVDTGYSSYAEMMKQKSMMNVMAGAAGEVQGAYSNAALRQQNQIRQFVGDDLRFNTSGTVEGLGSGSLLQEMAIIDDQISLQIESNNLNLLAAQNNLKQQMYEWGTEAETRTHSNEDMEAANKKNLETIEIYKATIKEAQETARDALKDFIANAETSGMTATETVEYMDRQEKLFKDIGYDICTIDYEKIDQELDEKFKDVPEYGIGKILSDTSKKVERYIRIQETEEMKLRKRAEDEKAEAAKKKTEEEEERNHSRNQSIEARRSRRKDWDSELEDD